MAPAIESSVLINSFFLIFDSVLVHPIPELLSILSLLKNADEGKTKNCCLFGTKNAVCHYIALKFQSMFYSPSINRIN